MTFVPVRRTVPRGLARGFGLLGVSFRADTAFGPLAPHPLQIVQ